MITKELLERKVIEATRKRESAIAAANGAIAEISILKGLIAELEIEQVNDEIHTDVGQCGVEA